MCVCLRVYTECVTECSGAKAGIVQEVKGKHRCAEVLFCSRKLYSLTYRSQRSHSAEEMALIGKGAAGFLALLQILMLISSSHKLTPMYIYTELEWQRNLEPCCLEDQRPGL